MAKQVPSRCPDAGPRAWAAAEYIHVYTTTGDHVGDVRNWIAPLPSNSDKCRFRLESLVAYTGNVTLWGDYHWEGG